MNSLIERNFEESMVVKKRTLESCKDKISHAADSIIKSIEGGGKVLFFGNGGSAADSQHIAAEFIGRFLKERRALPAVSLTTNASNLTCLSNDYSYDIIFARQIEALGKTGDVAFGITTSGNSKNVIEGVKKAKELGLKIITLTGCEGGKCSSLADVDICVPSDQTPRIQEAHILIYHSIAEIVENYFA